LGGAKRLAELAAVTDQDPRLNILFVQPPFSIPFGLDFTFDLFKSICSYLNLNLQLGAQYTASINWPAFLQWFQVNLIT
jgi:hypothetical protein